MDRCALLFLPQGHWRRETAQTTISWGQVW
jgi:hypothetical protein